MEGRIPQDIKNRQEAQITYYQWVPIILIFQAFLFKLPNLVWRMCNGYSGINLEKICKIADGTMLRSTEDRQKEITTLAWYMHKWVVTNRNYHHNVLTRVRQRISSVFCFCIGKRDGQYLTGFYLFVKILYCINIVGQFFLLNAFMANDFNVFGLEIILYLIGRGDWKPSLRFPRVTLCDYQIRQLANVQQWTVQCVLPVNMFNEKIFIFLWFWFFIVSVLTFLNMFSWMYYILFSSNKTKYLRKYLKLNNDLHTAFDKKLSRKFADDYLRDDGVFVLRVLAKNSSEMAVTDLVYSLWKVFKENYCPPKKDNSTGDESEKEKLNGVPNGHL